MPKDLKLSVSSDKHAVFQLIFEIFKTVARFIKILSGHALIIKLIFIKFFSTIWEIGGQMSWDQCLAESLSWDQCLAKSLIVYICDSGNKRFSVILKN